MPDATSTINSIKRTLRILVAATVVLYAILAGMAYLTWSESRVNKTALCALKADHEKRIVSSLKFLGEHPEGIAGIPAATIREGVRNQERTVEALSGVSC